MREVGWRWLRVLAVAAIGLGLCAVGVGGATASSTTVHGAVRGTMASGMARGVPHAIVTGHARFEVLTPTLIRLEYAAHGRFENRPTMVATDRHPIASYVSSRRHGVLRILTSKLALRYRLGSGTFGRHNLSVVSRHGHWTARPRWGSAGGGRGNLGGWVRALDDQTGPVPLHPGLLSRSGWHLLDDTDDAIATTSALGFTPRPSQSGYQDGYLFGYGRHYRTALRDLRRLTGPAPLLPRKAFGVWFSRYFAYRASDYPRLLARFRKRHVPVDTLSVDTDWKRQANPLSNVLAGQVLGKTRAYAWNGWEWNRTLFPDPKAFLSWAHRRGLEVALNIHPSIDSTDPKYVDTVGKTGPLTVDQTCTVEQIDPAGQCYVFDLTKPRQLAAYFGLHAPIKAQGADEWWFDWCCDATTADAPGLTPDTYLNMQYTKHIDHHGDRWLVLSRIGSSYQGGDSAAGPGPGIYAEHRWAIHFTGDTCATWRMLAFEARLTADEGNLGIPYVSHDIGSFNGAPAKGKCSAFAAATRAPVAPTMYARWVQFGAFQPIERLHSNHGYRLPWNYPKAADRAAAAALRLRESLVPYLYTAARETHDTGLPIVRNLYLSWPHRRAAYRHPSEYTVGDDILVRPVTRGGNPARARVWFPPGRWVDYFTGRTYTGPMSRTLSVPLKRMPVFVRAGAVLPTQPYAPYTRVASPRHLVLTVYPGGDGTGRLYDDRGTGFGYRHGRFTWTVLRHSVNRSSDVLRIGAARGHYVGAPRRRSWTVRFVGIARPSQVMVAGHPARFGYNARARRLTVRVSRRSTARPTEVVVMR
jgi:hypothetical protein